MPSKQVTVTGSVTTGAVQPAGCPVNGVDCVLGLNLSQTVQADVQTTRSINSPAAFVDLLANTGITNVRFLFLRVRGGTVELRLTTPGQVDQVVQVSELFLISNPVSGSEITAVAVQGVADLEILLAGT